MPLSGTKARPDETLTITAFCRAARWSISALVRRIGPNRLVTIVSSASRRSRVLVRSSRRMTPALLMSTLSAGCSATTRLANAAIASGSSTFPTMECMPSRPAIVRSSASLRRPATITVFPSAWKRSASSRPIPDPPPVMRIVFPVIFIVLCSIYSSQSGSNDPAVCEYRLPVDPGTVPAAERRDCVGNVGHFIPSYAVDGLPTHAQNLLDPAAHVMFVRPHARIVSIAPLQETLHGHPQTCRSHLCRPPRKPGRPGADASAGPADDVRRVTTWRLAFDLSAAGLSGSAGCQAHDCWQGTASLHRRAILDRERGHAGRRTDCAGKPTRALSGRRGRTRDDAPARGRGAVGQRACAAPVRDTHLVR
ncbi:hypothetical protein BQ8482_60013 [Mesorhizobium delmotii]|uniref:Uncharacterized protein n=1 Tax=Mesorhizobium delmotii TaxID=1631247 RepID=A0A2P9AV78_9HYPH|nr:hypothetical protein BQ8482_60013 [Mesorhizobium delmotii]